MRNRLIPLVQGCLDRAVKTVDCTPYIEVLNLLFHSLAGGKLDKLYQEFLFVLPHTSVEGAQICAERLREQIAAEHLMVQGRALNVTCSIGIAALTEARRDDPNALISAADKALYEAKQHGRNQVRTASILM